MCEADSDLWGQRDAFVAFWNLVRTSHPAQQCRWGAAGLIRKLKGWWPPEAGAGWVPPPEMEALDICGGPSAGSMGRLPPGQYFSCRGSTPATRGYTCGLWMLLHSLAAGCDHRKPEPLPLTPRPTHICARLHTIGFPPVPVPLTRRTRRGPRSLRAGTLAPTTAEVPVFARSWLAAHAPLCHAMLTPHCAAQRCLTQSRSRLLPFTRPCPLLAA